VFDRRRGRVLHSGDIETPPGEETMQIQVEKTGPTQRKVSVTVPAADVDAAFAKIYRQLGKTARLPGFRPGKIPTGLLEAHFGTQVKGEVQNELVTTSLPQVMQQEKLSPVSVPSITPGDLKRGTDFSYSAEIEIQPDIHLRRYKQLVVESVAVTVPEEEVNEDLESMRQQAAQLVPIMLRDVVQQGDIVQMDYEAFIGGAPVRGSKAENALIEIGGEGYLPGFSDGLLGAKVPSERELPVDFPADYTVKDLAGKKATFKVKIKELKTKELPKLDEDFAKDMGAESLEALKERVRGSIRVRRERDADVERRKRLMRALVDANPFDLPPSLIRAQADQMIAGAAARVQQLMGREIQLSDDDVANLRKDSMVDAELTVRSGILMLEVAKREGITVTEAEVDAEIDRLAAAAGNDAQRLRAHYADPEHRSPLRYRILEERTVALLLSHAVDNADKVTLAEEPAAAVSAPAVTESAPPAAARGKKSPTRAAAKAKSTDAEDRPAKKSGKKAGSKKTKA
jgi:trigger factor